MKEIICGVYFIRNLINNKRYIGSSSNIKRRWRHHKNNLKINTHSNVNLQEDWNKYGEKNFEFNIIEQCYIDELYDREKYWIKYYKTFGYKQKYGYNMTPGGSGFESGSNHPNYGKIMTEEQKQKIRESNIGKHLGIRNSMYGIQSPMFGKHHSEESKQKISKNHTNISGENHPMFGKKYSNATSKFHGVHLEGDRWKAQIRYNNKTISIGRFEDEIEAAKAYDNKAIEIYRDKAKLNFPEDHIKKESL